MAREPVDDLLAELDAALRVSPSPDAIARVRERVRAEAPASGSRRWWLLAAASVVIVIAGAAAMVMTMRRDAPAVVTAKTEVPVVVPPVAPVVARPAVAGGLQAAGRAVRPVAVLSPALSRPEVLVPPEEGEAIRRLLRAIRDGRATAAPAEVIEDADGRLLEAKPIEIPLIKIEPLPGTPALGSGGREK